MNRTIIYPILTKDKLKAELKRSIPYLSITDLDELADIVLNAGIAKIKKQKLWHGCTYASKKIKGKRKGG